MSTGDLYGRQQNRQHHRTIKRQTLGIIFENPTRSFFDGSAHARRIDGKELIRRMLFLLRIPGRWTQEAEARNWRNRPCEADSAAATRWSITGALYNCAPDHCNGIARYDAYKFLTRRAGVPLVWFNDNCSHEQVVAFLDLAIQDWEAAHA